MCPTARTPGKVRCALLQPGRNTKAGEKRYEVKGGDRDSFKMTKMTSQEWNKLRDVLFMLLLLAVTGSRVLFPGSQLVLLQL